MSIKDIEIDLFRAIEDLAKSSGESNLKILNELLRKALNMTSEKVDSNSTNNNKKRDLSDFYGVWNEEEAKQFEETIQLFEQIDEKMWD